MKLVRTAGIAIILAAASAPLAVQAQGVTDDTAQNATAQSNDAVADNGRAKEAARQTQGQTFGERVAGGLQSGAGALAQGASRTDGSPPSDGTPTQIQNPLKTRHDTVKNSIGNVR